MEPLFTVVVSGYGNAPHLPRALESAASQTFRDFEAICYVEDSPDASLAICEDMSRRDPRFTVAAGPKTGGGGATRNYGIAHASGEYLVFLDGDDRLAPDMLGKLAAKLARTGPVDVLAFAARETDGDDESTARRLSNFGAADAHGVFSGIEAIRRAGRNARQQTWLGAYRTAFLRDGGLRQTDGDIFEDFEWTPRVWFAAQRFAYLDDELYAYCRRSGSLLSESSSRGAFDICRQVRRLCAFADARDVPADILSIWSDTWLASVFWFLFHPSSARKVPDADRKRALALLFDGDGAAQMRSLAARASLPKRLAMPLLRLAASGWTFPAKSYFRSIYYPLVARKASRRQST